MPKKEQTKIRNMRKIIFYAIFSTIIVFLFFVCFPNVDFTIPLEHKSKPLATIVEKNENEDSIGFDEIFDYSPLFIPTRWNASRKKLDIPLPSVWEFDKAVKLEYAEELNNPSFLLKGTIYSKRAKHPLARLSMRDAFIGYGRADMQDFSDNDAGEISFSLIDLRTGKKIKSQSVKGDISKNMFSIAEFKVSIARDGWVMKPLVTQSSGDEKSDAKLADMLTPALLLKNVPKGDYKAIFVP